MKHLAFLIFVSVLLQGCTKPSEYELAKSDAGRLYRLEKSTGEISIIEGYTITKLREPKTGENSQVSEKKITEPTTWPSMNLPGTDGLSVTLMTIWREGNMYYRLAVSPADNKRLSTAMDSYLASAKYFTLEFLDKDGFALQEFLVPLKAMTGIVDNVGKKTHYEANSKQPCNMETYLALTSWNVEWNF